MRGAGSRPKGCYPPNGKSKTKKTRKRGAFTRTKWSSSRCRLADSRQITDIYLFSDNRRMAGDHHWLRSKRHKELVAKMVTELCREFIRIRGSKPPSFASQLVSSEGPAEIGDTRETIG
ncbi:hypothetical protein H6P81_019822 [Aristolochia fimbriata]|uniref:Uncharacterized protein n=1 Tax=Aristolochia fimbriata TaxID=158543 RepID=A0AAV7DSU5_ARIFI|nr:hypothetical protein H6P81_019822 [Aristolochia fimbriata]